MQTLSPSQLNLALACPEKWLARYVLKEVEAANPSAARGSAAHRLVESSLSIPTEADAYDGESSREDLDAEALEDVEAIDVSKRASEWFVAQGFHLVQAERTVEWNQPLGLPNVRLLARPDALARMPSGELMSLEWKFPNAAPVMAEREDYRFQATIGALALRSKQLVVEWAGIAYVPCDGSPILFDRWRVSDREIADSERMRLGIAVIQRKSKPPRPGLHCGWCFHKTNCSAFVNRT